MKRYLFILTVLISTFGCQNKPINIDELKIEGDKSTKTYTFPEYKSDSTTIDLLYKNYSYTVLLKIGAFKKEYDLKKWNVPIKNPPELYWTSNDYACMVTWYSQSQSRHIFIPLKQTNEFIYIDKDIEKMDSLTNNIVYIDTVFENQKKVIYKVENLLTRKSRSIAFRIDRYNGNYPFYDKIILTKNNLTIQSAYEKKSCSIEQINSKDL
jgi:hypothetical protein